MVLVHHDTEKKFVVHKPINRVNVQVTKQPGSDSLCHLNTKADVKNIPLYCEKFRRLQFPVTNHLIVCP